MALGYKDPMIVFLPFDESVPLANAALRTKLVPYRIEFAEACAHPSMPRTGVDHRAPAMRDEAEGEDAPTHPYGWRDVTVGGAVSR